MTSVSTALPRRASLNASLLVPGIVRSWNVDVDVDVDDDDDDDDERNSPLS